MIVSIIYSQSRVIFQCRLRSMPMLLLLRSRETTSEHARQTRTMLLLPLYYIILCYVMLYYNILYYIIYNLIITIMLYYICLLLLLLFSLKFIMILLPREGKGIIIPQLTDSSSWGSVDHGVRIQDTASACRHGCKQKAGAVRHKS